MLDIPWKMAAIALRQVVKTHHFNQYLLTRYEGRFERYVANREDIRDSNQVRYPVMGLAWSDLLC